ncbi:MAG: hypothetical protein A2138_06700 [Deltaproteobacteria bacterium RBG_16_71_12]|nr:MAG: hypothetical protein A2138_06700 [Deltaproteobacteria bacterium RBG_16_71_12]
MRTVVDLASPARAPRLLRVALVCAAAALAAACPTEPQARAFQVASRAELIGGPRALGEVGDYILENDRARFLVQDAGFSRGFGVFGGALLDADLVRPEAGRGDSEGGRGKDNFGEMFPAFFLEALEPIEVDNQEYGASGADPRDRLPAIEVLKAGGPGQEAEIVIRGLGGDFLALTQSVNEVLLGDDRSIPVLQFESRYIIRPRVPYLELVTRVQNISSDTLEFPKSLLGAEVPTPFGDVVLFGAGNKVFLPHEAGFDLRYRLEDIYHAGTIALPAFPGLVAEFIASTSKDVSYGVMTLPVEQAEADKGVRNFAEANPAAFPDATDHSLHVPFIAAAFTGVFQVLPPNEVAPNDHLPGGADEVTFRRIFIVGDGDVASVSDVVYQVLHERFGGAATGLLQGRVKERQQPRFVAGASVIVTDTAGNKVTQAVTNQDGRFDATLRPGDYQLVVVTPGATSTAPVGVTVAEGQIAFTELFVDAPAELVVTVVEPGVGRVPSKVSVIGTAAPATAGLDPKDHIFDLSIGEPWRFTDFVPDEADDAKTRRFLEGFAYSADGVLRLKVRPGSYTVVAGRGTEYDRAAQDVEVNPGVTTALTMEIRRVVDTTGYVGADFHLHSQYSLDSGALVKDRIASYAGEGVEYAVSTDHNFVVDYQPALQQLGIEKHLNTAIGLELTTIDRGHFNGFPLRREQGALADGDIASRTYGSFEWAMKTPTEIFDKLRALGLKDQSGAVKPIVLQVNHPRDSILGYFDQYGVSADDLSVQGQSGLLAPDPTIHPEFDKQQFNFDFDAFEVFNGKRFEFLHSYRVPDSAPRVVVDGSPRVVDPVSCCEVAVGDVLRDMAKRKCRPLPDGTDVDECACDADTFGYQLEQGNCGGDRTGDVAFPGVIEDWIMMLESGRRVVGTANSDSHEPEKDEPGCPRTYVRAPSDEPAQVRPDDIVAAFTAGDVLMTNGPFVRVAVEGDGAAVGMGATASATDGRFVARIHVDTAPWVVPDTLNVYLGTTLAHTEAVPGSGPHDFEVPIDAAGDGILLVEVRGSETMFPSIFPNEVPPLQFTDVIGSLGSSFGLGGDEGALEPALTFVTTPYALTNPVWLDADGDGEVTPSRTLDANARMAADQPQVSLVRPVAWVATEEEALEEARAAWEAIPRRKRIALSRLPRWLWPSADHRDVRRVLIQFVNHRE